MRFFFVSVACQQQNHQPGPSGQGCLQENLVSRRRGVLASVDLDRSVEFYCTHEWNTVQRHFSKPCKESDK